MSEVREPKEPGGMSIFMGGDGGYSLAESMIEVSAQNKARCVLDGANPELMTLFLKPAGKEIYERLCSRGRDYGIEKRNGNLASPPARLTTEEARYTIERHYYRYPAYGTSTVELEAEIGEFLKTRLIEHPADVAKSFPLLDFLCYEEEYDPPREFIGITG